VIGLGAIVCVGLSKLTQQGDSSEQVFKMVPGSLSVNFGLALVFVLYAFGGWPHAVYVAAEVRDSRRNLPRALLFGIAGITLIYLLVNGTYAYVLGYSFARRTATPAADVAGREVALLVMLSALGAINGMILTGTRIYAVWGADYPMIKWLGMWSVRRVAPLTAIAVQAVIAVMLILLVSTATGQAAFDNVLASVGLNAIPWTKYNGGFETLVVGSAPLFWLLTFLTAVSVFVLRYRDRSVERPFKVPIFPVPVVVFCATCIYMLYASLDYARWLSLIGFIPAAVGLCVWFMLRKRQGS
jgi:APA family basic amino acid/polyamine antiporter